MAQQRLSRVAAVVRRVRGEFELDRKFPARRLPRFRSSKSAPGLHEIAAAGARGRLPCKVAALLGPGRRSGPNNSCPAQIKVARTMNWQTEDRPGTRMTTSMHCETGTVPTTTLTTPKPETTREKSQSRRIRAQSAFLDGQPILRSHLCSFRAPLPRRRPWIRPKTTMRSGLRNRCRTLVRSLSRCSEIPKRSFSLIQTRRVSLKTKPLGFVSGWKRRYTRFCVARASSAKIAGFNQVEFTQGRW